MTDNGYTFKSELSTCRRMREYLFFPDLPGPHFTEPIDHNFQDSSFEECSLYMPAGEDVNSSSDSSYGLRIKIVPDVGSRAGIDYRDFDTKLDDNIKIWFDGFKDNFKLCE
jgi:hypothetical protein